MATPMTPEELRRQQQSLTEQIRQEQVRRAEQTRQEGLRALAEQVRLQRQNMMTGRQQLAEQGWQVQRNIEQQAQARGLGTSGLKNLSLVQSQMAQGQAASALETQNVNLQRAVMDARAGVSRQAESDIRSAEIAAREGMLSADREYMAADQARRDRVLTLLQLAQDPNMTPEMLAKYAETMDLSEQEESDVLEAASLAGTAGGFGDLKFRDKIDWAQVGKDASVGGIAGASAGLVSGPLALITGTLGAVVGGVASIVSQSLDGRVTVTSQRGGGVEYDSWDDALKAINAEYADKPESDKIKAVRDAGRVMFQVSSMSDKKYRTYNEALEAYRQFGS